MLWQATPGTSTNVKHYHETYNDQDIQEAGQNQHIASPKSDVVVDQSQPTGPQHGTIALTTDGSAKTLIIYRGGVG